MRVFVVCTGRCGSVTLAKACEHLDNFTVGHEEINEDLEYPDNHIAINPQFSIVLDELVAKYPDAVYVYLERCTDDTAKSFQDLDNGSWLIHWQALYNTVFPLPTFRAAKAWVRMSKLLITSTLPSDYIKINLATIKGDFLKFVGAIGGQGNIIAALAELDVKHNANAQRNIG